MPLGIRRTVRRWTVRILVGVDFADLGHATSARLGCSRLSTSIWLGPSRLLTHFWRMCVAASAHLLGVSANGAIREVTYWATTPDQGVFRFSPAEAADELDQRLTSAVQQSLVADVPAGVYVSPVELTPVLSRRRLYARRANPCTPSVRVRRRPDRRDPLCPGHQRRSDLATISSTSTQTISWACGPSRPAY